MMAPILGLALALLAAYTVLQPLLHAASGRTIEPVVPLFSDSDDEDDPALARRDRALAALKEIDFDRATGKLSDVDYERMKAQFTQEALAAIEAADVSATPEANVAPTLPPSHVPTIRFCLECGTPLA